MNKVSDDTSKSKQVPFYRSFRDILVQSQSTLYLISGGLIALNTTMLASSPQTASAATIFLVSASLSLTSFYATAIFALDEQASLQGWDTFPFFSFKETTAKEAKGNPQTSDTVIRKLRRRLLIATNFLSFIIFLMPALAAGAFILGLYENNKLTHGDPAPVASEIIFHFLDRPIDPLN